MILRSYDRCVRSALVLVLLAPPASALAASSLAQQPSASKPVSATPEAAAALVQPKPTLPSLDGVRVTGVERWDKETDKSHPGVVAAGLQQIIVIQVDSLDKLVKRAECQSDQGLLVDPCDKHPISLFLDGREVKGLVPESGAPEVGKNGNGSLRFHLERSHDSDETWADLLGEPIPFTPTFFHRPTDLSVGLAGSYSVPTMVRAGVVGGTRFHLVRIRKVRFFVGLFLFAAFLWKIYDLARSTNLLRDSGDMRAIITRGGDSNKDIGDEPLKPYSLGRWQMAVWFVLVIGAFSFIWLVTGASDTITSTVLTLLGIGAGTALGAAAIDTKTANAAPSKLRVRLAQKVDLDQRIAAIETVANWEQDQAKATEWASLVSLRDNAEADISKLRAVLQPPASRGWWKDIISDEDGGYSFHRFQIFVWTVVLVGLFLISVWSRLSMPEFGATLLAVMGISGGTYLGFKIPENQT